jgi:hypothetical protein
MPRAALSLVLLAGLAACGSSQRERGLSGAAIGAGVGAVGAEITGGSAVGGAVVGAAAGAAVGLLTSRREIDFGELFDD